MRLPVIISGGFFADVNSDDVVGLIVRVADEGEDVLVDDGEVEASGLEGSLPAESSQVPVQLEGRVPRRVRLLSLDNKHKDQKNFTESNRLLS